MDKEEKDFDFKFQEADMDSDTDSIASDELDSFNLDEWQSGLNIFDSFEFRYYKLKSVNVSSFRYENNNELFVDTIMTAYSFNSHVTSIRLLADIHDLDNEDNIRWSQNIRFEISSFEDTTELRQIMLEHLNNETAPVWHRLLTDETSDKGYNKVIKYHKDYFDLCINKPNKTRTHVTTVSGEEEIHPGIFVKTITDHGLAYRTNDCLIKCLNEAFNLREDPVAIRKELRPNGNYEKDIHTIRHIKAIAKRYNTMICISDILEQTNLRFNKECTTNKVKLIKVGKVIGLLDRIDYTVDKRNLIRNIAYFDLETVGPDQRVYAFTWRHRSGDVTTCHNDFDYVEGFLTEKMVEALETIGTGETLTAYAWNGSRFDNWIVFKLLKKKYNKRLWIHDIIVNSGNELLMFKLTLGDDDGQRHMVFKDPKKMFNVSIPEACKVFNISHGKHEFNHDEVDEAYMNNTFDDYIKNNRGKILDYVRQDGVILEQVTNCIKELYDKEDINMYTTLTRSVASSISWQKTIENHGILKDVTLSPYKEICGVKYNDIMDHAIGGRTQCIEKGEYDNVCGIDVNSMYPYVCANNLYPCGDIIELKDGEIPPKDKLGLYLIRIKKQSYPNVIPYRKAKHYAYDWNYEKEFEKWVTSVDMFQLDDYDVIKGFYWTKTTDKFYKDFMIDHYNERASIEKTDPRNLHIKLKMNGVTGSAFQHSFREMIMVFTKEEFTENVKKYSELVKIIGCDLINEKQYIVTMRPIRFDENDPRIKAQREFCKGAITQKPWVLTMFTYSYARKLLRDEWIKLESKGCKVVYCDTDSLFFTNPNKIIKEREYANDKGHSPFDPRTNSGVNPLLGKWSIECWNDHGVFHSPKIYAIKKIGKLRIKGVGYNSLVTDTNYTNKDINYEQKLKLFIDCATNGAKRPNYNSVVDLVNGIPLKTINFIMERSKDKGIVKDYVIKLIKC